MLSIKNTLLFSLFAAALALSANAYEPYKYCDVFMWERGVPALKVENADKTGYMMSRAAIVPATAGAAFVCGGERPDLFLRGGGFEILYRYVGTAESGAPIFEAQKVASAKNRGGSGLFPSAKGALAQSKDGKVHWLKPAKREVRDFVFNPKTNAFEPTGDSAKLPDLPSKMESMGAFFTKNGGLELYFSCEQPNPEKNPNPTDARLPDWKPYDCNNLSTELPYFPHSYVGRITYPKFPNGEPSAFQMVSPKKEDTLLPVKRTDVGVYKKGEPPMAIVCSRFGNFKTYQYNPATKQFDMRLASDKNGNALRHPNFNAALTVYPDKNGEIDGLIVDGEGLVYYYASLRKRGENGAPLFADPVPVMEKGANLFMCPLATPTVVDWDGDGVLDILTGGSEGIVLFIKNLGTNAEPKFDNGKPVSAGGRPIKIEAGYSGSVQGTAECRWGYISPLAVDWNGDGLPDLIVGDIRGEYTVFMNRGTKTEPKLDKGRPLYCKGLELHGRWRCGAATAEVDGKRLLAIVDENDKIHLYSRVDDYNVEDIGTVRMDNGEEICVSIGEAGASGRCKLNFADWDGDGALDLIVGAGRTCALPNRITGYPTPMLLDLERKLRPASTVLFVKNLGTNQKPVFAHPVPFSHPKSASLHAGGCHETGVAVSPLGSADGKTLNLIICDEGGRGYLIPHADIEPMKNPPHENFDKSNPIKIERYML